MINTNTFTTRIRIALLTLVTAFAAMPVRPAAAYIANITAKDIKDAGGYCKGERCYINGRAYQCVGTSRCS